MKTQSKFWYCRYKYYRDTINTLIAKRKQNHLRNFFQENCKHLKNVWSKINKKLQNRNKHFEEIFL